MAGKPGVGQKNAGPIHDPFSNFGYDSFNIQSFPTQVKTMHPIIKRLFLAGLMTLPAACAHYSRQYYDSGSAYYPNQYDSGYGVVEQNYYNTYSYPRPVYRTDQHHHHYDNRNQRYPDRRYQDTRRYSNPPGTTYRNRDSHDHRANDHYNWNAQTSKPYDTRKIDRDRQRYDNRNEGRQRRPDDPNAYGQSQRQQNWERKEARRQADNAANRPAFQQRSEQQYNASAKRDDIRTQRLERKRERMERKRERVEGASAE